MRVAALISPNWQPTLAACFALLFSACTRDSYPCHEKLETCVYIEGVLSTDHLLLLESKQEKLDSVFINSRGGKVQTAVAIGKFIYQKELDLYIYQECSSACAEYVLPSASDVYAIGDPLIGFHGNNTIVSDEAIRRGFVAAPHCRSESLDWINFIYLERNLDRAFVQKQIDHIGIPDIDFVMSPQGCLLITRYVPPAEMWVPGIKYINENWGLEIKRK